MIGSFTYKGIHSSMHNLICKSVKRPLLPALRSNTTTFTGVSGVYDSGNVEYDLRNITLKLQYLGNSFEELRTRARSIAAWLGGGTWGNLIIDGENDKYYYAKIEEDIELDTIAEFGEADITFVCQPFAYSVNTTTKTIISGNNTINYTGTRHINNRSPVSSLFTITFNGSTSTNKVLTMNGVSITVSMTGATGAVTLDNVNMTATNIPFSNLSGDVDKFFTLNPGSQVLNITNITSGNVTFRPMFY